MSVQIKDGEIVIKDGGKESIMKVLQQLEKTKKLLFGIPDSELPSRKVLDPIGNSLLKAETQLHQLKNKL